MTGLRIGMGTPASFSTQSYTIPLSGGGNAVGIPNLPSPEQLAPTVMGAANSAPACPPLWPPCATGPMLHTHPIALADSMAAIPSPQQLAPHVFMNGNNQAAQTAPLPPVPPQPPQPKQPQPPVQQPPAPPPVAPAPAPPTPKAPVDEFDGALSDEIVKSLNRQLNDPDEITRATAATDLSKILQEHPKLSDSPEYKPTVDAFMEKIMKDPSTLVRGMGEMTFQLGAVKNPSEPVRNQLKTISKKNDKNLTKENDQASSILANLENGTLGKDLENLTGKKVAKPGAPTGANANDPGAASGVNAAANPEAGSPPHSQNGNPSAPAGAARPPSPPADPSAVSAPALGNVSQSSAAEAAPDPAPAPGMAGYPPAAAANSQNNPMPGAPPQIAAYAQGPAGSAPGLGVGMPAFGNRLNVMSSPQSMGSPAGAPSPAGQRLNLYEGPRS